MKMIPTSRKHRYVARISIFLITVALIIGMICFPGDLGLAQPFQHALGIQKVAGAEVTTMAQSSGNVTTYDGDLIIDGYEEFVIENCTWVQKGNVYVKDSGKLIIRNCVFQVDQAYWAQYEIIIEDYGCLVVEGAHLLSDKRLQPSAMGHAEVTIEDALVDWALFCREESRIKVTDTAIDTIWVQESSTTISVSNSTVDTAVLILSEPYAVTVENLKPDYHTFWQFRVGSNVPLTLEKTTVNGWWIGVWGNSTVTVADSEISFLTLGFHGYGQYPSVAELNAITPGFYETWSLRGSQSVTNVEYDLTLKNTVVDRWCLSVWGDSRANISDTIADVNLFQQAEVRIEDSTVGHIAISDDAEVTLTNTRISQLVSLRHYHGSIESHDTVVDIQDCSIARSSFVIRGDLSYVHATALEWDSSNATRNFSVAVKNKNNSPIANASLTLLDRDNELLWNGATDSMGEASFDVIFTDSNYADTLGLEVVKGNLFATRDITFLSDTPVLLTALAQYNLTTSSTAGGNVTAPGQGTFTYDEGKVVYLVASPASGYKFVKWTGDVGTIANVNAPSTTIIMNGDYSITANFEEIPEHTLTISSAAGGSVTTPGEGDFTYEEGAAVGLKAEPEEGYQFVNWTGDVDTIADVNAASTTITMNNDYSIAANFEEAPASPFGCFIATAAYGTSMAEEIQILREFRDKYLLTNSLGQGLVDVYYRISPPIADFITEHPSLKPIVRAGLMPVVAICSIVLDIVPQSADKET